MSADGGLLAPLAAVDPEIAEAIESERARESATLDLVASENFAPVAVLEAQGSVLTNKYADGYPGARQYDGCEYVDVVERLAVDRLKALFAAEHANVQPYSGSSANAAVLHALCEPGDTVLGFDFAAGGHPTQYDAQTFAGRFYRGVAYGVSSTTGLVDMGEVAALAAEHRPKVVFAGGACYPRVLDFPAFRRVCDDVGAYLVVDMAHFSGLVAAGVHPDPGPYADVCTMTVHKTLGGPRGGAIVCRASLAGLIDAAVFPGEQGGPLMHTIAAKAVAFKLCATDEYRARMARTVAGARTLAAALNAAGDPIRVLTGGTDCHLLVVDTGPGLPAAGALERLHAVGISANAMRIPSGRADATGLRLGATSLATRGFAGAQFEELAEILVGVLGPDHATHQAVHAARVAALAADHRPYARP